MRWCRFGLNQIEKIWRGKNRSQGFRHRFHEVLARWANGTKEPYFLLDFQRFDLTTPRAWHEARQDFARVAVFVFLTFTFKKDAFVRGRWPLFVKRCGNLHVIDLKVAASDGAIDELNIFRGTRKVSHLGNFSYRVARIDLA